MGRIARWTVALIAAAALGVLAVTVVAVTWKDRATAVCEKNKPTSVADYTVEWETNEFAFVCKYESPETPDRRVGIVDAFHGEGREHGPNR